MNKGLIYIFLWGFTLSLYANDRLLSPADSKEGNRISHQYFCDDRPVTLADIVVFNTPGFSNILWFKDAGQKEHFTKFDTELQDGEVLYAFQGMGKCFKPLEVHIHIKHEIPTPTTILKADFCEFEQPALKDVKLKKAAGFSSVFWFTDAHQEGAPINPETRLEDGAVYYAFFGIGSCVQGKKVQISIGNTTADAPVVDSQFVCESLCSIYDIKAETTTGNLFWFTTDDNSGTPLSDTQILTPDTTYYVFQSLSACAQSSAVKVLSQEDFQNPQWSFVLHPNPVCGVLHIDFDNTRYDKFVRIFDTHGKVLFKDICLSGTPSFDVNMKAFSSGAYWVKVTSNGASQTQKILVE